MKQEKQKQQKPELSLQHRIHHRVVLSVSRALRDGEGAGAGAKAVAVAVAVAVVRRRRRRRRREGERPKERWK